MELTLTVADFTIGFRFRNEARRVEIPSEIKSLLSDKKPDLVLEVHYDQGLRINLSLILLLVSQLARGKIIFLHACSIWDQGSIMLFVGRSGSGKSTMARLWSQQGATILNEDLIILRQIDGDFWCYDCPWVKPFGVASRHSVGTTRYHSERRASSQPKADPPRAEATPLERMRLNKIFLIRHSRENRVRRLKRSKAVRQLFTHAKFISPTYGSNNILNFLTRLEELTKLVPVYELGFVPDERVVDFVRRII